MLICLQWQIEACSFFVKAGNRVNHYYLQICLKNVSAIMTTGADQPFGVSIKRKREERIQAVWHYLLQDRFVYLGGENGEGDEHAEEAKGDPVGGKLAHEEVENHDLHLAPEWQL